MLRVLFTILFWLFATLDCFAYGAIAGGTHPLYDVNQSFVTTTHRKASQEAIDFVLSHCGGIRNCKLLLTFKNTCAAYLGGGYQNRQTYVATGATADEAKNNVVRLCERESRTCDKVFSFGASCDRTPIADEDPFIGLKMLLGLASVIVIFIVILKLSDMVAGRRSKEVTFKASTKKSYDKTESKELENSAISKITPREFWREEKRARKARRKAEEELERRRAETLRLEEKMLSEIHGQERTEKRLPKK